ncbi:class I SAM-dependent methyltransferase [Microvirga zambiensis]|uniref:class I SAM-dependent methyltransferase n=1 Tax=Microvirga zambiensis TaxID=1402137 RepID=UPI0019202EE1|nr:class I SAM-dependent methyltransferase [Microvirga zambiensis]
MPSSFVPDETTISLFQQHWRVYRIMVEENFLCHREVYDRLHEFLAELEAPFRFLDVGCGDAACAAVALKETPIASYHGIDLAPEALVKAQINLTDLSCPVSLEVGDYAHALHHRTAPADVVWIGLSLHHSRRRGKLTVMRDVRRILAPGGILLFYENTRRDGESRDEWLARWDLQRPAWTAYDDADWTMMRNHVRAADYPETCSDWHRMAEAAGFSEVRELFVAPTDLFRMYAMA